MRMKRADICYLYPESILFFGLRFKSIASVLQYVVGDAFHYVNYMKDDTKEEMDILLTKRI